MLCCLSVDGQARFHDVSGQYWRLLTPAFLHFGWLHIAFNSLWMWELGSKVERELGGVNMALLFCTIALVSNSLQFAFGGSNDLRVPLPLFVSSYYCENGFFVFLEVGKSALYKAHVWNMGWHSLCSPTE